MKIGALWAHQISFGHLFLPMCYHWWELHVDDLVSHKKDGRDSRVQRLRACEGGAFSLAKKEPLKVCIPKINIDLKPTLCTTCIHLEAPNVCMWYVVLVLGTYIPYSRLFIQVFLTFRFALCRLEIFTWIFQCVEGYLVNYVWNDLYDNLLIKILHYFIEIA